MVVGPDNLAEKASKNDKAIMKRLEDKLDESLSKLYCGERETVLHVGSGLIPSYSLINVVLDKYKQAGWSDVKYNHFYNDGDGHEFIFYQKNKGAQK